MSETFKESEHYAYWGALQLALNMKNYLQSASTKGKGDTRVLGKKETIVNILDFLCQDKYRMINFLYNDMTIKFAPVKDKTGKLKAYKPIQILFHECSKKKLEEIELISENEYKYRNTARILADALEKAVNMICLTTGRDSNDIFNQLIQSEDIEIPETMTESKPEHELKSKTVIVLTETEYEEFKKAKEAEKTAKYAKCPLPDVGFRVYKLSDAVENETDELIDFARSVNGEEVDLDETEECQEYWELMRTLFSGDFQAYETIDLLNEDEKKVLKEILTSAVIRYREGLDVTDDQ